MLVKTVPARCQPLMNMLALAQQATNAFQYGVPKGHSIFTTSCLSKFNGYTSDEPISTRRNLLQKGIHKAQLITSLLAGTFAILGPRLVARADVATATTSPVSSAPVPAAAVVEPLGPPPTDFGLIENDYYGDAQKVVSHMRYACQLPKDSPILAEFAGKTKREMVDFVSFYRRFQGISGKQSFSLLYTSINVLAGHYSSYGLKVAVPEKRRKRLLQELNDIDKNIKRRR